MNKTKCPVCGSECVSWTDSQENVLHESQDKCPDGCWGYYYDHGNSDEFVGDREWFWHYTDSAEKQNGIRVEIKAAISAARERRLTSAEQ